MNLIILKSINLLGNVGLTLEGKMIMISSISMVVSLTVYCIYKVIKHS